MKIAVAIRNHATVAGHAGQSREWLVYQCLPGHPLPAPQRVSLTKEQVLHRLDDSGPHPLDGVEIVIAGSAEACADAGADLPVTSAPHGAPPRDVAVAFAPC